MLLGRRDSGATLMWTVSSGLFPSSDRSDRYHNGPFYDYGGEPSASPGMAWYYLAHVDAAKVMQNEGYIQMSGVLSEHRHSARQIA